MREIAVASVRPNPEQPRRSFDATELQQLADSIAAHGVLQPIIVVEAGDGYTLVAGERRLRASKVAGLATIPAIVRTANEQERLELALVENLQRADLNAIEEARGFLHLIDVFGLTQERVAERVGRSSHGRQRAAHPGTAQRPEPSWMGPSAEARPSVMSSRTVSKEALLSVVARSLSVRQTQDLTAAARDGVRLPFAARRRS
jgi:ParB-like chromosome segregation protein Spo0J